MRAILAHRRRPQGSPSGPRARRGASAKRRRTCWTGAALWWDIVGGIRQDFRPGAAQTWATIASRGWGRCGSARRRTGDPGTFGP